MRFLVDAQLPPALARFLASLGEEAIHVLDAGLLEADDGGDLVICTGKRLGHHYQGR